MEPIEALVDRLGRLRLPFLAPPAELTDAVRRLAAAWRVYDGTAAPLAATLNGLVV
jgi:hypothetical protein